MQSTKTATTIEKVNWEEPKETPPSRMSAVCSVIMAKPVSSATAAKLAQPAPRSETSLLAADARGTTACGRSQPMREEGRAGNQVDGAHPDQHGHQPEARHQPVAGGQRPGEGAGGVEGVDQRVKARGVLQRARQRLGQDRDGAAHQDGRRQHEQRREHARRGQSPGPRCRAGSGRRGPARRRRARGRPARRGRCWPRRRRRRGAGEPGGPAARRARPGGG